LSHGTVITVAGSFWHGIDIAMYEFFSRCITVAVAGSFGHVLAIAVSNAISYRDGIVAAVAANRTVCHRDGLIIAMVVINTLLQLSVKKQYNKLSSITRKPV
jgi:hypothetical protein